LTPILNNPELKKILETNFVPILSTFEPAFAGLPDQLKDRWDELEGKVKIGEKEFYVFEYGSYGDRKKTKLFISMDGETIYSPGREGIIFKNKDITVYEDKIVNTQTGEVVKLPFKADFEWGKLAFNFTPAYLNYEKIDPVTRELKKDKEGRDKSKEESSIIEDNLGNSYELKHGKIFINNEEQEEFGGIKLPIKKMIKTASGEIVFLASNIYENAEINEDEKNEEFYLINSKGEIIWKLDDKKWGDKIYLEKVKEDGRRHHTDNFMKKHIGEAPRCIMLSHDTTIEDQQPIIKLVRYDFVGENTRIREIIGYVTADGQEFSIEENNDINEITLAAKYSWEGSCACCSVSTSFHAGSYSYRPFSKEGESVIKNLIKLPIAIESDFKFDPVSHEWSALACDYANYKHKYLAVFDSEGNYLRAENIGEMTDSSDYKDSKLYYLHRMAGYAERGKDPRNQIDLDKKIIYRKTGDSRKPAVKERDFFKDGLLDIRKTSLTDKHAEIVAEFLSKYPVPAPEKLERLFYRVMQFRDIDSEDLSFVLPIFYEFPEIDEKIFSKPVMENLKKIGHLDKEKFSNFVYILNNVLPEEEELREEASLKLVKFFMEKLQGESVDNFQNMLRGLKDSREYSNSINSDGFSLIKYKTQVPHHEISKEIRPLITFMQRSEEELAVVKDEKFEEEFSVPSLKLSQVIQWKRLREKQARDFSGNPEELYGSVVTTTEGKVREHIIREITHAIHFQSLNSTDLYLRELVQNAVDVIESEGIAGDKKRAKMEILIDRENNLVTKFSDPVGMDIKTLINYFLVPGESTKLDRKSIGFYGQGIYTLFDKCEEVRIKTGRGDGNTWQLRMKPVIEHEMVVDVEIEINKTEEDYKGTTISKIQKTDNPYVEAAYIRDSLTTLISALDANRCEIILQGERINAPYAKISQGNIENFGEVSVYRNPNNIVTQNGLFVKEIGHEYLGAIPSFMNDSLRKWGGIVIDLPSKIELTRSRQDIANKDTLAEKINPVIQQVLVGAYLKSFIEKFNEDSEIFPFKSLPYDYFIEERYSIDGRYEEDVKNLMEGKPLRHLEEYKTESNAVKFMTLLPVVKVGEEFMSVDGLKNAYQSKKHPFDKENWSDIIPYGIYKIIKKQKETFEQNEFKKQEKEKFEMGDMELAEIITKLPEDLRNWVNKNIEPVEKLDSITRQFIQVLKPIYHPNRENFSNGFYYNDDSSTAHAYRMFPMISWNLQPMTSESWRSPLDSIKAISAKEEGWEGNRFKILDTLAHEFVHTIERFNQWTHDPNQEKDQARVLLQFLKHGGMKKIGEAI